MRNDALGFFWEDLPVVKKAAKEVVKRTPPERTWERPDYLPGLDEALTFNVPELTIADLLCTSADEELMFDVEVYGNYFLASFESKLTGKVMCFELSPWKDIDLFNFDWVLRNFCIVSFNGIKYDLTIAALVLAGKQPAILKWASDQMIKEKVNYLEVLKQLKVKRLKDINHIDLLEVAPLRANLKIYTGRLHCKRMQDLPFHPSTILSYEQAAITKYYNVNDLRNTLILRNGLAPQIDLRYQLSNEYQVDLRSKSDAQMAEIVIGQEVGKLNGRRPIVPIIEPGTTYRYNPPAYLKFQSALMQWTLDLVCNSGFVVGMHGGVLTPPALNDLKIPLGHSTYTMGIGGLHSTEKRARHVSDVDYILEDVDAVSFYPKIILNLGLFPSHLGPNFLRVYNSLVERRIQAKRSGKTCKEKGDKAGETMWENIAESLKILINGSFGKLGSMFSILYGPDLLTQVTLTGQLSLLMLIERLELVGIHVVSGNTDGIVIKIPRARYAEYLWILKQWEKDVNFETEQNEYIALFSKDVNNYIAVKARDKDGKIKLKTKGAYANPWSNPTKIEPRLHKNPTNQVCADAIEALFTASTAPDTTIRSCKDITKFISIRTVEGGAVKGGEYLGKSIRWYYSTSPDKSEMVYALTGNKVPRSDGAKPCMDLPDEFPSDVNYDWYLTETIRQLKDIAYLD